jgi:elongation factor 1-gamma
MSDLRIFSYLPNPRIWKATIAARLLGVAVEVRGAAPRELGGWLWDFDARPLTDADRADPTLARRGRTGFSGNLYKSDAFLEAHPFGTVPAAFSGDGQVGIFESNSIMRTVARLGKGDHGLYGRDPYSASRIDSFLDASLVFARDAQNYLLVLGSKRLTIEIHDRARGAFESYMSAIESVLSGSEFIVGSELTLADICFVCEYSLFSRERAWKRTVKELGAIPIDWSLYPRATTHYEALCAHPQFAPDVAPFREKLASDMRKHDAG